MNKVFVFVRAGIITDVLYDRDINVYIVDEDVEDKENCISKYGSSCLEEEFPSLNNIKEKFYDKKTFELHKNYLMEEFGFMNRESIANKVKGVILDKAGMIKINDITDETMLIDDIGFDSLDIIETIIAVENIYDISIPDKKGKVVKTVGDIINCIEEELSNG